MVNLQLLNLTRKVVRLVTCKHYLELSALRNLLSSNYERGSPKIVHIFKRTKTIINLLFHILASKFFIQPFSEIKNGECQLLLNWNLKIIYHRALPAHCPHLNAFTSGDDWEIPGASKVLCLSLRSLAFIGLLTSQGESQFLLRLSIILSNVNFFIYIVHTYLYLIWHLLWWFWCDSCWYQHEW